MMKKKNKRETEIVLAIFPNARGFGYALIENADNIIDYGIANIQDRKQKDYLKRFQNLLEVYLPTTIVLERYEEGLFKKSKKTEELIESFKLECNKKLLPYKSYTRNDIRDVFGHFNAKSKYEIALVLIRWLEELKVCLPQPRKAWEPESYKMGIFDAFSLAMTHFYQEH